MTKSVQKAPAVVQFETLRVRRDRAKVCGCAKPTYEIDTQENRVTCLQCGAIMDPMQVLVDLSKRQQKNGRHSVYLELKKKARNGVVNFLKQLFTKKTK